MDNNEAIKNLQKQYGENIFMMAITHLFEIGKKSIEEADIENECEKIIDETPECAIMTGEMQASILRCSAELANFPLWDILCFVKTDVGIYGATVHPGMIIEFRRNSTDKEILTCVIPSGTPEEVVENVINDIENHITEHMDEKGAYRIPYEDLIRKCFKEHGIRPHAVIPDKTFCF